jgi:hypothetical protein
MNECFDAETWAAYFEGVLPQQRERHLAACSRCRDIAAEFARVEEHLAAAAQWARQSAAMEPRQIHEALGRFHARMGERRGIACCLDALNFFLSGMLGSSACGKVLAAAARHAEVTEAAWPGFISRLSRMSSDLCGEGAGAIVSYIGKLAEPEPA